MSAMNPDDFPIRLQQVFFTRQVVIAVPGYTAPEKEDEAKVVVPQNSLSTLPVPDRERTHAVIMKTVINPDQDASFPYSIDMECHAIFIGKEDATDEEIRRAVTITGHSVVYGAIREAVYWMTGRQPYGPMALGLSILQPAVQSNENHP
ncbi:hypothetical protein ACSSZE_05775 [Acidithiobacillus caldus]